MSAMQMVRSAISFAIAVTIATGITGWTANAGNNKHVYTVRSGDCLWVIARRYGISVDALRKANRLPRNAKLHPGQKLLIPTASSRRHRNSSTSQSNAQAISSLNRNSPAPYRVHIVRKGECAYTIAKKWGIPVGTLLKVNQLREDSKLYPGERLRIPMNTKTMRATTRQNQRVHATSSTVHRKKAFVIATNVNVRSNPSIRARRLGKVQRGMWGWVLARKGAWYKIALESHPKRIVGWIRGDLLKIIKVRTSVSSLERNSPIAGVITGDRVRLRRKPSLRARILKLLHKGERVTILGNYGGWYKVQVQGGRGWVSGQYVKVESRQDDEIKSKLAQVNQSNEGTAGNNDVKATALSQPKKNAGDTAVVHLGDNESAVTQASTASANNEASSSQSRAQQLVSNSSSKAKQASDSARAQNALSQSLVRSARRYLGVRYRRGSSYPSRGFDCSGFVYYLLRRHGIIAPRTTRGLFRIGKPVPKSKLRPGDLVFFRNTYRRGISHVGIYIGNGKFIHASSSRRRVVITSLNSRYYAKRYAGARRVTKR